MLVADDSAVNRKLVKRCLQRLPACAAWEMVEADTAERALELATEAGGGFGLIVMDEHFGVGLGLGSNAVRAIREHEREQGEPPAGIVSCSGEDASPLFYAAGVTDVWPKPLPEVTMRHLAVLLRCASKGHTCHIGAVS